MMEIHYIIDLGTHTESDILEVGQRYPKAKSQYIDRTRDEYRDLRYNTDYIIIFSGDFDSYFTLKTLLQLESKKR